jgi:hypothetical protein
LPKLLEQYRGLEREIELVRIESGLVDLESRMNTLKSAIDESVIEGDNYEDDSVKITRVQAMSRKWDTEKLEKILPRAVFRKIIKVEVDPDKLEQASRAGELTDEQITPALNETSNKPYAKWTTKTPKHDASAEADSLAAKLA